MALPTDDRPPASHSGPSTGPPTNGRSAKSQPKLNHADRKRLQEAQKIYGRGRQISTHHIKDKKLRSSLVALEDKYRDAALKAKDAEILLENKSGYLEVEDELERTYRVRQDELKQDVAIETAKKGFELKLEDLGPYNAEYSRNGRDLLLFGRKGHVATTEWREGKLSCELQLGETVRDAKWLHNNQYFAVAQKKYVYIYDRVGVELHCLKKHMEVSHMEFLPYHFLLATLGSTGYLKYNDTSTGQLVAEIPTRSGSPTALAQNAHNAILHVGHQNGTVTLWSPNSSDALVKLLTNRGPVRSIAIDREGRYMVVAGQDLKMAVWDIRMYKEVNRYFLHQPGRTLAVSDRNLTAVGWGTQTTIWKGLFDKHASEKERVTSPYMTWGANGQHVERVRWCPFEDVLGISHDHGFSSILVPGAGEPNFDALEANPYENKKQRQQGEVKALLNKLQPEMISLNPDYIGNLDPTPAARDKAEDHPRQPQETTVSDDKTRKRGKNSSLKRYLRKKSHRNVIDEKRLRIEALLKEQSGKERKQTEMTAEELGPALARFVRKGA
ncbi:MAG: Small subunit (SSU) processome component [Phylliscum demangeonii]|nr:MAG: Small subunit (SSU) processome component [Phylliscum demangeonii]